MPSAIDITKPIYGTPTTQSVRDNFHIARDEITALQDVADTHVNRDLGAVEILDYAIAEDGGVLLRFGGPRLAAHSDDLVPVRLREGERLMGSAMTWASPGRSRSGG